MKVKLEKQGQTLLVHLSGVLNEHSQLDAGMFNGAQEIKFNLNDLAGINSSGIRLWFSFIVEVSKQCQSLTFEKCSSIFVDQLAILPQIIPVNAKILSFYAPYVCEKCEFESEELVLEKEVVNKSTLPEKTCPKCGGSSKVDDLATEFKLILERLS